MTLTSSIAAGRRAVGFATSLGDAGAALALVDEHGNDISYADLARRVAAAESVLGPERRLVLLAGANRAETVVWYLAALGGGHPVLLAPGDRTEPLVDRYDPDVVIDAAAEVDLRRGGSAHDLHPDLALLLSTSGSTGSPKLVRLSHRNVEANAAAIAEYLGLTARDRAITSLPIHYCYGLSVLHSHLSVRAGTVLTSNSVVDPCFWSSVVGHGVTGLAGVPHTFDLLGSTGFERKDVPSLRYLTQAGGRMAPDEVRRWVALCRRTGRDFFVMYGQTEATARMAYLPPDLAHDHPGAIGIAIPGGELSLSDGELVYRGPNVMLGYAEEPGDLARGATLTELRTGDLARRSAAGLYEITGRASRFVKPFGLRVDLDRLESSLAAAGIPALCAGDDTRIVVGIEDDALVDAAAAALAEHVGGLPPGSTAVTVFDELPRSTSGKPDHRAVLAAAPEPTGPDDRGPSLSDPPLTEVFGRVLGRSQVAGADTFVSLGGDSLSYVEMAAVLERRLGQLPDGWHLVPIDELPAAERHPGRRRRLETNVVLRAVAITLIVCNHAGLFVLSGGAHVLLAVSGFNFARFRLAGGTSAPGRGIAAQWRGVARIAVPSMAWIGAVASFSPHYDLHHALLVNSYLGAHGDRWSYWFIETLLYLLVPLTALLTIPSVRRFQRRHPAATIGVLLAISMVPRFELLGIPRQTYSDYRPQMVLWLFVLGWATTRLTGPASRAMLSAVAVLVTYDFFGQPARELVVVTGLLALIWIPTIAVPAPLDRVLSALAGASLVIYLTHYQILPHLGPLPSVLVSLGFGVAVWKVPWGRLRPRIGAGSARGDQSLGRRWSIPMSGAKGSPIVSSRSSTVRIVQRSGAKAGSSTSSHVTGTETGAPARGRTL